MSFDTNALRAALVHGPVARIVVTDVKGSAPREVGASMLVWPDGQSGTIGGGRLEWEATALAHEVRETGDAIVRTFPLGPDLGQCCGGSVQVLIERYEAVPALPIARRLGPTNGPVPVVTSHPVKARGWYVEPARQTSQSLWIWGAGHIGRALVDTLSEVPDVAITWVDTVLDRFPEAPRVDILPVSDLAKAATLAPPNAHHIIATYGHDLDLALCHAILTRGHRSCGLIGSATKWTRFRKRLTHLGHSEGAINTITCPIGDPGLGRAPAAIAIGVAAQLLSRFAQSNPLQSAQAKG